jgi:hypothetical protein
MNTTDNPREVLDVLSSIVKNAHKTKMGFFEYQLGGINLLSKLSELAIIKKLHNEGVIKFISYTRSDNKSYSAEDDFYKGRRMNPSYRFLKDPPGSAFILTEPLFAELNFNIEKLEKEISELQGKCKIVSGNKILEQDKDGNFIFNGKTLQTRNQPLNKKTNHYRILNILYHHGDQEGVVRLSEMIRRMRKMGIWKDISEEDIESKIRNTINLSLFRQVNIAGEEFHNSLPGTENSPIIETYKDKKSRFVGWKLNNPKK